MNYEQTLALCRGYVKDHALSVELDSPRYKAFRMAKPGTRTHSVLLTFTPEGITLSDDYRVTAHSAVSSDPGYGLDWFTSELGSDYLAEKFLRPRWVRERCAEDIEERAEYLLEQAGGSDEEAEANALRATARTLREIAVRCRQETADEHDIHDALDDVEPDLIADGMPGYTWDYMERASLQAIQEKFRELYLAWASGPGHGGDWLRAYEALRQETEQRMERYSQKLGWVSPARTRSAGRCWMPPWITLLS